MMKLFTPGPTPVLPEALTVMGKPIPHHRTPIFEDVLEEVRVELKQLFGTQQEVILFASSGTGAMEGAVTNLFSPGDKVIVVEGGKFGERWGEITKAYALNVITLEVEWGEAPSVEQIDQLLSEHPDVKGVFTQFCETSTATDYPVEKLAAYLKSKPALFIVDAISSLGVSEFKMDDWGVDAVVSGSQKGLCLPPGLSFVALSEQAWKAQSESQFPKYYFDFKKEHKGILKNHTAYTPAVSLVLGLREVLSFFKKEGLSHIYGRYVQFSKGLQQAAAALQLEIFSKHPSNGLVAIRLPESIDGKKVVKLMRDEHKMMIAGGQKHLAGKIIRIATIGHHDPFDMISVFSALEDVLKKCGATIDFGKGVAALEKKLLGKKS